jgi:hypothetical protein
MGENGDNERTVGYKWITVSAILCIEASLPKKPFFIPSWVPLIRSFSWLSNAAELSLQKNVLCAFLWLSQSWKAFQLLSCHSSPCRNMDVLAGENLSAVLQMCVLAFPC